MYIDYPSHTFSDQFDFIGLLMIHFRFSAGIINWGRRADGDLEPVTGTVDMGAGWSSVELIEKKTTEQ